MQGVTMYSVNDSILKIRIEASQYDDIEDDEIDMLRAWYDAERAMQCEMYCSVH